MDLIFAKGYSSLDLGKVLSKALVHDMDECFSGDMIRMFKYSDPILKMEVNKACETFMSMLSSDIAESYVRDSIYADWFESKNEREGSIVAFADYLSVLSYIHQEIDLGNHRMERQVPELKKFHGYFREEKFEFLKEYIDTAGEILNEIDECIKERKNGSRKV
jgi:5'-deoxynucleotidase YfbR-like HD superfamily hydrolase